MCAPFEVSLNENVLVYKSEKMKTCVLNKNV